jgi:thymidylate synthase (FAD)
MNVKLIAATAPTIKTYVEGVGKELTAEEFIVYTARVSNPTNQHNHESADRLIGYLIKHQHWSPFEMVNVTMEINTTRDIARQILRHRSFSFQEFSQRYADATKLGDFDKREARLQDEKNRQNSIETSDVALEAWWDAQQKFISDQVHRIYSEAINRGIAKEQARAILPEGMTRSTMYMNGTLRSWIHYIELRAGVETQKEHRDIARDAAIEIIQEFPFLKPRWQEMGVL